MTHFDIATFPVPRLVQIVADLLSSICQTNDRLPSYNRKLSVFDSRAAPHILLRDYLDRILKYTPYTNEVLLSMLIYFDRLAESKTNAITLNSLNIHRFIITGIVIATKSTSDIYYRNSRYSKVGGIGLDELYHLELEFLKLCDFRVHVRLEQLQNYADQIWNLTLNSKSIASKTVSPLSSPSSPSYDHTPSSPTIKFPSSSISSNANPSLSSSVSLPLTPPYDSSTAIPIVAPTKTPAMQHRPSYTARVTQQHRPRHHPYSRPPTTTHHP